MLDWPEIVLRLGVATLAGGLIGLNRDLHGKPIGLKTLGLVGLATAMVVMLASPSGDSTGVSDAASRIIQGILTGIGFLGAGVIMQFERERRIEGLTTAASIWVAAGLGMACGGGLIELAAIGLGAVLVVLIGGGLIERALGDPNETPAPLPPDNPNRDA